MDGKERGLSRIGDLYDLFLPVAGSAGFFGIIGLTTLILHLYLVGIVFLAICGILVFIVVKGRLACCRKNRQEIESALFKKVIEEGVHKFDLEAIREDSKVSYPVFRTTCCNVYKRFVKQALKDLVITERERTVLDRLGAKLGLEAELASDLEQEAKKEIYDKEFQRRMEDSVLTEKEASELESIRRKLSLEDSDIRAATKLSAVDAYKKLFKRFAEEGIADAAELDELCYLAKLTGLTPAAAADISPKEALKLFRRTVSMICQDGVITRDEDKIVNRLEDLLRLAPALTNSFRGQIEEVRELDQIRKGKLPRINHQGRLHLESTELCHWLTQCDYVYQTPTRTNQISGELIVTDRRMIFTSAERSFEFSVKRIINLRILSDSVHLTCSSTRGQGYYCTSNPPKLGAVLEALVRHWNLNLFETMDAHRSRHIPKHVKVGVWQRDGGQCVNCGAMDYLEYDHIIPFSRGGANSEKNIQLLCGKCNRTKGAELA